MTDLLRQDYGAMTTMIFGDVPEFDAVLEAVAHLEDCLNSSTSESELGDTVG
jgi:hypothetical protein